MLRVGVAGSVGQSYRSCLGNPGYLAAGSPVVAQSRNLRHRRGQNRSPRRRKERTRSRLADFPVGFQTGHQLGSHLVGFRTGHHLPGILQVVPLRVRIHLGTRAVVAA